MSDTKIRAEMAKYIILFTILLVSIKTFGQLDSTVIYLENDSAIFKTVYSIDKIEFFKKDSLNNWYLYAYIEDTPNEILHYNQYGELTFKETWDLEAIYCYFIDSLGNEKFSYKKQFFETEIPTGIPDSDNPLTIYQNFNQITVKSVDIIKKITIFDVSGMIIAIFQPESTSYTFEIQRHIVIIKVNYGDKTAIKKIIQ